MRRYASAREMPLEPEHLAFLRWHALDCGVHEVKKRRQAPPDREVPVERAVGVGERTQRRRVRQRVEVLLADRYFALVSAALLPYQVPGDSEQPGLGVGDGPGARERLQGLQERVLHDVLALDRRPGHAGAIAMELRAERGRQDREIRLRCVRLRHRSLPASAHDSPGP